MVDIYYYYYYNIIVELLFDCDISLYILHY
jgi:hypothetical protein